MRSPFSRIFLTLTTAMLLARQGLCAPETLSHFLEVNVKGSVIVMEGDRFIDRDRDALVAILKGQTTSKEKIAALAEKCDYTVLMDEGTFLLRKRYSDPMELPCVSADELIAYVQDVAQASLALNTGNAEDVFTTKTLALLASLPPEQWEQVKTDVLPVRALSAEGRKQFDGMMLNVFHGDTQKLSSAYSAIWRNPSKGKLSIDRTEEYPLMMFDGGSAAQLVDPVLSLRSVIGKVDTDESEHLNASNAGTYLQDVLARLNKPGTAATLFAAKPLLHTPVTVVHLESAAPRQVLRNIAHLYGFRFLSTTTTAKLERQTIAMGEITDIGPRVAAALPLPIKRTLENRDYKEASRRLLSPLIPKLEKEPTHSLPVSGLTQLQKTALAFNQFTRLAMEIHDGAGGLPAYVRQTDTLYLKFRRTPSQGFKKGITFGLVCERNGKLENGLQLATVRDIDRP